MKKSAMILTVSFGSSSKRGIIAVQAIEEAIGKAFPDWELRRAFTCQRMIDKIREYEGLEISHIGEALERAAKEEIAAIAVQPIYLIKGYEYGVLSDLVSSYGDRLGRAALGKPLLSDERDLDAVIKAVIGRTASYDDGKTAICLVGHGTESGSNRIYIRLQEKMEKVGYGNYYIGTLKKEPGVEDVQRALKKKGCYKRVVLEPLMAAAGVHVYHDMAGEEADSWKSAMERDGYEVECILEGLGQNPAVCSIYVEHVRETISSLQDICI